MANERKPTEQGQESARKPKDDRPRSDLPPARKPYYEGYFGTDEEQGAVRERDDGEAGPEKPEPPRR